MQLARVILRVRSPERLARFYVESLGMTMLGRDDSVVVGYGGEDAAIELCPATSGGAYEHRRDDRYWKVGITLPNVDMAREQLRASGVAVTEPRQFGEIGYMCHLEDPEGFSIELLQHQFEGNRALDAGDPNVLLGGGARIGQITLRVADLDAALRVYRDQLGMALLSIQPVTAYGFTLYFLAFTDEHPPHQDLEAVGNREWLWQRPYTTLELQHVSDAQGTFALPADRAPGFSGLMIKGAAGHGGVVADDAGGRINLLT